MTLWEELVSAQLKLKRQAAQPTAIPRDKDSAKHTPIKQKRGPTGTPHHPRPYEPRRKAIRRASAPLGQAATSHMPISQRHEPDKTPPPARGSPTSLGTYSVGAGREERAPHRARELSHWHRPHRKYSLGRLGVARYGVV